MQAVCGYMETGLNTNLPSKGKFTDQVGGGVHGATHESNGVLHHCQYAMG